MRLSPRGGVRTWGILALAASLAAVGCNSSSGTVSGKVTLADGSPVKGGNVHFLYADGNDKNGGIGEDGSYAIVKAPLGDVTIVVENNDLIDIKKKKDAGTLPPVSTPPPGTQTGGYAPPNPADRLKYYVEIPAEFTTKTSPLTYKVTGGDQTKNISLKK